MNRRKLPIGGLDSLISTGKEMFHSRLSSVSNAAVLSTARFRGKLGSAIAVITSLIVGFLTIPNNMLYFIDNRHSTRAQDASAPSVEYAYIHSGIALITLGCLAMVVSIVLSYFAAKSTRKMDGSEGTLDANRSTTTVLTCLVMMNLELFMAVIAGCMELLYRPLTRDTQRLHNVECAIAVFNIIIYIMYVVTMVLTSRILRGKREKVHCDPNRELLDVVTSPIPGAREYAVSRGANPYNSQSSFIM